jgi:hypothetical protein
MSNAFVPVGPRLILGERGDRRDPPTSGKVRNGHQSRYGYKRGVKNRCLRSRSVPHVHRDNPAASSYAVHGLGMPSINNT